MGFLNLKHKKGTWSVSYGWKYYFCLVIITITMNKRVFLKKKNLDKMEFQAYNIHLVMIVLYH